MIYKDRFYKLEMLILVLLEKRDYTHDNLVEIIHKESQGAIYPKAGVVFSTLFYFEEALLVSSYEKQDDIYYHIEKAGLVRLQTLKRQYWQIQDAIQSILDYQGDLYE